MICSWRVSLAVSAWALCTKGSMSSQSGGAR
ncbi:hypothetical protein SAMN05443572_106166 [Myxococcus fulvus]|uniref:Lipoprotein n=1 Tax=Myxococcus fulvus TaxID=33 RepID=A0ABY1CM37_MYXFU|nr:hypothetical protein SAMN05443572_106166 [Myxococcus fulvus]